MDAVRLMGEISQRDCSINERMQTLLAVQSLLYYVMLQMTIHLWQEHFTELSEDDAIINVGVSGPGVVKYALESVRGESFEVLCETIKKTAFKITRVGQLVAQEASKRLRHTIWYN